MSSSAEASPTPTQTDQVDTSPPAFEKVTPPEAPKPEIPRMIKRPEEKEDYAKEFEESQKKFRSFEEEQQHQIQRYHELNDKYSEQGKALLQSITDQTAQLDQAPKTQPDPELQKQIQSYQQKQPNGVMQIFGMMMLGVGLAFTAFGWKRGWGARSGIMQGWGNAFKAMAQNQKETAKEQLDNTYRVQELVRQENQERHQNLMEIYQNRRLNLEEKKNLFNETEKLYGMDVNQIKTESNMTAQQMKLLQSQMKAQRDMLKLQIATHNNISNFMFNTQSGKLYREYMVATTSDPNGPTKGRMVDPGRSHEDLVESQEIMSYGDWLKYQATKSKTDESGKLTEMPKPKGILKPGEEKKDLPSAAKKFGDQFFGQ